MANPKQGLDYFDLSVDFFDDDKIALTEAKYGIKATYIVLRLLAKLYRFGFYLQWGDDEAALFARSVGNGIQASLAKEVVDELVRRGFFDKAVLDSFHVLTSKGIQTRYFNAIKRRTPITVDARYLLVDVSNMNNVNIMYAESPKMYAESEIMYAESRQSRVDKSRGEERRVESSPSPPLAAARQAGGSESRGGAFSVFLSVEMNKMRSTLTAAGVSEQDAWEFSRLIAAPEVKPGYGTSIANEYAARSYADKQKQPFYETIQSMQQLEERGRIHPMPHDTFRMHRFIAQNLLGSDADTIYRMVGNDNRMADELQRLVNEVLRPGSSVNQPAKFIIAGLRKLQAVVRKSTYKL